MQWYSVHVQTEGQNVFSGRRRLHHLVHFERIWPRVAAPTGQVPSPIRGPTLVGNQTGHRQDHPLQADLS
eukprot:11156998-Lingulodinium_polyedra.AAC.1